MRSVPFTLGNMGSCSSVLRQEWHDLMYGSESSQWLLVLRRGQREVITQSRSEMIGAWPGVAVVVTEGTKVRIWIHFEGKVNISC